MSLYRELIETCENLLALRVPGCWVDDDGWSNAHWTASRDEMISKLKRPLTDMEVTVLSLSRCYGPIPCIPDHLAKKLWLHVWPDGNKHGIFMWWDELLEKLRTLPFSLA